MNRISSQGGVSTETRPLITTRHLSFYGEAALEYAEIIRWLVIPAYRKRSALDWNPRVLPRIPDRKEQEWWWRSWPDAQLALVTGARSRVIAIDADPRHGGSLEAFYARGWPHLTPTARSGSCVAGDGGGHSFYAYPDDGLPVPSVLKYADGCEVKSDGAIIILAPSRHHVTGRRYEWLPGLSPFDVPLAEIPAAVIVELRAHHTEKAHGARTYRETDALAEIEGIDIGWSRKRVRAAASRFYRTALWKVRNQGEGRNNTLFWLSGQLLALGFAGDELSLWAEAFAAEVGGDA